MHGHWILVVLAAVAAPAAIVDRVAIAIGTRVVTDSEIELRLRLTAFQNGRSPAQTLAERREATERLIDQKLVEREMEVGRYPRRAADSRTELLADYAKRNFKSDAAALSRALEAAGLQAADLEDDLARQADLLTFLDLRFRPAVEISEQDVQKFFDDKIKPRYTDGTVELNQVRAEIERQIANQRADAELEIWLKTERKRTRIQYLEKELAP